MEKNKNFISLLAFLICVFNVNAQNFSFSPRIYSLKDDSLKEEIFIYPLVGWNENDKWMPGIYLTNELFYKEKFRYQLLPLYSTKEKTIVGAGKISFNQDISNSKNLSFFLQGKRFHLAPLSNHSLGYFQYEIGAKYTYNLQSDSVLKQHIVEAKYHKNETEGINYKIVNGAVEAEKHVKHLDAIRTKWQFINYDKEQPFFTQVKIDAWTDFARMTANYEYDYNFNPKRWLTFRAFAGLFFYKSDEFVKQYDARISTNMYGWQNDIFYDGWFLGRNVNKAIYLMQGMSDQGSLYSISPLGKNWDWAISTSGSITFPIDIPIRVYASLGIAPNPLQNNKAYGMFEGGILIMPPKKFFEIAFPLILDNSSKKVLSLNTKNYWQRIRIIVNFDKINPHSWLKKPHLKK